MATYQGGQQGSPGGQQKPPQGQERNVRGQGQSYGQGNRVTSDCRSVPGSNCSLAISGTEQEVVDLALQHAVSKHGLQDNQETRTKIKQNLKGESIEGAGQGKPH